MEMKKETNRNWKMASYLFDKKCQALSFPSQGHTTGMPELAGCRDCSASDLRRMVQMLPGAAVLAHR